MAIADLLAKLVELKSQLVANLSSMGVTADESEKLNTLVPKVLECKSDVIWSQDTVSTEVTSVNIPNGVTSIGSLAFGGYTSLIRITVPDSVTSIGSVAFTSCTSLASIIIPESVTSIGRGAFSDCTRLAHIYYTGTQEQWNAIIKDDDWNYNMGSNVKGGTVITYNYTG